SSRRRHTRFSRDWSSDVCSSDLPRMVEPGVTPARLARIARGEEQTAGALSESITAAAHPLKQPGVTGIDVGWTEPAHEVVTQRQRGWPTAWFARSEWRWYEIGRAHV